MIVQMLREAANQCEPGCFSIESASSLSEAVAHLQGVSYDVVILDLGLPDSEGLATLHALRKLIREKIPIIVITGTDDAETELACFDAGVSEYTPKPFNLTRFLMRIRHAILRHRHGAEQKRQLVEDARILREIEPALPPGEPQTRLHEAANNIMTVAETILARGLGG